MADNDLAKCMNEFFSPDPVIAVAHEIYQALDGRWNDELITTTELEEIAHGLRHHGGKLGRLVAEKLQRLIDVERANERRRKDALLEQAQKRKEELLNG